MRARRIIQTDLVRLLNEERLLRLTEAKSGLSLEKKIDPKQPIIRQKQQLLGLFEALLAKAESVAA